MGAALLLWIRQGEGGKTPEDRLVARIAETIRAELARVQVSGAGPQAAPAIDANKAAAFLRAGKR
jgi:hypothetical protein